MKAVNIYLNFPNGTTEKAFEFYRSVFGGEFTALQRFKDAPMAEQMPAAERNGIMHVSLPLTNGTVLMGTDACASMAQTLTMGNNFYIALEVESEAEATALFGKLSTGGKVEMAPQKMFWGAFFGSWTDRFGVQWMVNYTYPRTAGA
jgi:PhnB protein